MAITNGKVEAIITIPSSTTLSISDSGGAATATVTAGTYYWSSADSTANDFAAQLAADLTAAGAGDTWTVTIGAGENGTGQVTIDNTTAGSFSITWSGTSNGTKVRDLCGFTADISGATSAQTGANHAEHIWIPDHALVSAHGSQVPIYETDATVTENPAGNLFAAYGQRKSIYAARWLVSRAKMHIQGETTTGESWEQFWLDCILGEANYSTVGDKLRLYWDADDDATYETVRPSQDILTGLNPEKGVQDWTGLYWVVLDRLVEVPA